MKKKMEESNKNKREEVTKIARSLKSFLIEELTAPDTIDLKKNHYQFLHHHVK